MIRLMVVGLMATILAGVGVAQDGQAGSDGGAPVGMRSIQDVGGYTLIDHSGSGAVKLSGIAYGGGSAFYAVGGGAAQVYRLAIDINPQSGAIRSVSVDPSPVQLKDELEAAIGSADLEGVAVAGNGVWVVDEDGPQVSGHALDTGRRMAHATPASGGQLHVFTHAVGNRGWESLARSSDGSVMWTANEEALTVDGSLATTSAGTVVRLQRFDADLQPTGQWAYITDPISGRSGSRFDRSGVVDMLVLDDGALVVLERSTGRGFRIQLYLVDFRGATDVSAAPFNQGLRNQTFTPVSKTKLWMKEFTSRDQVDAYFVGITLGPVLSDGSRSVILIADNGGTLNFLVPNNQHLFYGLKMTP